jgi:hypothetical protein
MPRLMRTKASKPALKVPKLLHYAKAYLIRVAWLSICHKSLELEMDFEIISS